MDVDQHHTVEDVGIALGEAFAEALGDKKGILRAGYFLMPMDETLAIAAVDLSGRVAYAVDDQVNVPVVGDLQSELVVDFFEGFARGARANVHLKVMYGRSNHHKIEAIFKAFARALRGGLLARRTNEGASPKHQGAAMSIELSKQVRDEAIAVDSAVFRSESTGADRRTRGVAAVELFR